MSAFATPGDVETRWRPLSGAETIVAVELLNDASTLMRLRVTGLDTRIVTDPVLAAAVVGVAATMVKRVLINPEGWREVSIEDSRRVAGTVASDLLYLTVEETAILQQSFVGSNAAFVVSLGG